MTARRGSRIFVCSFSGAIGDMKRKDQRDRLKVLAVLKESPRFSVWDASDNNGIANTMTDLMTDGLIDYLRKAKGRTHHAGLGQGAIRWHGGLEFPVQADTRGGLHRRRQAAVGRQAAVSSPRPG